MGNAANYQDARVRYVRRICFSNTVKAHRNGWLAIITTFFAAVHALASTPTPPPSGFLEGRLKIPAQRGVDIADHTGGGDEPAEFADYTLTVLTEGGDKEVTQIQPNDKGEYRVALPPGKYILAAKQPRIRKPRSPGILRPFSVLANRTVRVDMEIGSDIRQMR